MAEISHLCNFDNCWIQLHNIDRHGGKVRMEEHGEYATPQANDSDTHLAPTLSCSIKERQHEGQPSYESFVMIESQYTPIHSIAGFFAVTATLQELHFGLDNVLIVLEYQAAQYFPF